MTTNDNANRERKNPVLRIVLLLKLNDYRKDTIYPYGIFGNNRVEYIIDEMQWWKCEEPK